MSPLCLGLEVILLGARLCLGEPAQSRLVTVPVCALPTPRTGPWQRE
jgi:hypothetical protein